MPRAASVTLIVLVNYILQSTALRAVAILGVKPDTTVLLIVCYAMLRGDVEGALFGLFAGLTHDLLGGFQIGPHALIGFLTGFFAGKPFKDFFSENNFLPFFIVVFATLFNQSLFYCLTFLFAGKIDLFLYVKSIVLPKTIYTSFLAIPFYSFMYFFNSKLERFEHGRTGLFRTEAAKRR